MSDFGVDVTAATKALDKLSNNVRANVMRKGSRKAAEPIRDAMALMAPRRAGQLMGSIIIKTKARKAKGYAYALVGPFGKVEGADRHGVIKKRHQGFKARWMEYGTRNMKARPFIDRAQKAAAPKVPAIYAALVEKELRKL